jgi:hypothetical protein
MVDVLASGFGAAAIINLLLQASHGLQVTTFFNKSKSREL